MLLTLTTSVATKQLGPAFSLLSTLAGRAVITAVQHNKRLYKHNIASIVPVFNA